MRAVSPYLFVRSKKEAFIDLVKEKDADDDIKFIDEEEDGGVVGEENCCNKYCATEK